MRNNLNNSRPKGAHIITLIGRITEESAMRVVSEIMEQDMQICEEVKNGGEPDDIVMLICSEGGSVPAGLAVYDAINNAVNDVWTIGYGMVYSMGAFLLSAGTKGKRIIMPSCEAMIHQPLGGTQGQATDIEIHANHILRTRERLNQILASNTNQSVETIRRATERDNYLTAEEAVAFGLADRVSRSPIKALGERMREEML